MIVAYSRTIFDRGIILRAGPVAMIVAYSRTIAMHIYDKLVELRPDLGEKVKVVMTASNKAPEEWHAIIGNKQYKTP